jgi:hypothetical protein
MSRGSNARQGEILVSEETVKAPAMPCLPCRAILHPRQNWQQPVRS